MEALIQIERLAVGGGTVPFAEDPRSEFEPDGLEPEYDGVQPE